MGSNALESSPALGIRCGGTLTLRILVLGPEISLDITVAGVKCLAERGFREDVGALRDGSGTKK